jgi:two-component sensor histidine kinase
MQNQKTIKVLLISQDKDFIYLFLQSVIPSFSFEAETSPDKAAANILNNSPSIVLCEHDMIDSVCSSLPEDKSSHSKWVIISPGKIEEHLISALKHRVHNIFPKNLLKDNESRKFFLLKIALIDNSFGLQNFLNPPKMLFYERFRSKKGKRETIEKIVNYFATCGYEIHQLYYVRLVLEELVNNALFHAFLEQNGKEKYHVSHFEKLADDEQINIDFGNDSESIGFAVTDNRGRLHPMTIVEKLARQHNRKGIYDESGRGIYLSAKFSSILVINIEKNKRTQILALFSDKPKDDPKPLSINFFD